jgi:hypothetical protein
MVTLDPVPGGANEAEDPTVGIAGGAITRDFRVYRFARDGDFIEFLVHGGFHRSKGGNPA